MEKTKIYRVSDDEGWQDIFGKQQLINFACERLSYGEVYGDLDEERYDRVLAEYEETGTIKDVKDAYFIVETDNWYIEEIEVY